MNWPPYTPDPCDFFFLWGHWKNLVYYQNPTSLAYLYRLISQECLATSVQTLQKVCTNFSLRLRNVVMNGGHIENIVI